MREKWTEKEGKKKRNENKSWFGCIAEPAKN